MGKFGDSKELPERQRLTNRQMEVARLVAEGYTNEQIAAQLFISPNVVGKHIGNIYQALNIRGLVGKRAALRKWMEENYG